MYFRSSGQIYVDVIKARDWFKKIGISTSGTRLDLILNSVYEIATSGTDKANPLGADATQEDVYYALSDGAGFGLIASEMSKLPSDLLPRGTLRDILQGPLATSKEDPSSSDARNKFVELELAANFSLAGFRLLGFDDLRFEFEGHSYLVECKRPTSDKRLDDNINKAYVQLSAKIKHPTDRGIVAIAVEKIFNLERRIHSVALAASPSHFAKSVAKDLRGRISKFQSLWVDPRMVGILAIIRFLMTTKESSVIGSSYSLALIKFATRRTLEGVEEARLDRLIQILQNKFTEKERSALNDRR